MGRRDADTVTISRDEYQALRTLAAEALERGPRPSPKAPLNSVADLDIEDRPLTWQERNIVRTLVAAEGALVPMDRLVRHITTTNVKAEVDAWVVRPMSQLCRVRIKLRAIYGRDCIETVWHQRQNKKGRMVRDWGRGAAGYRWIGPSLDEILGSDSSEEGQ